MSRGVKTHNNESTNEAVGISYRCIVRVRCMNRVGISSLCSCIHYM